MDLVAFEKALTTLKPSVKKEDLKRFDEFRKKS
ncbi:MAG: hypothetical protein K8T20_16925 [Planctomycetes bacterium]|nr:hypothetical protein [Planctomycetota bacterium]